MSAQQHENSSNEHVEELDRQIFSDPYVGLFYSFLSGLERAIVCGVNKKFKESFYQASKKFFFQKEEDYPGQPSFQKVKQQIDLLEQASRRLARSKYNANNVPSDKASEDCLSDQIFNQYLIHEVWNKNALDIVVSNIESRDSRDLINLMLGQKKFVIRSIEIDLPRVMNYEAVHPYGGIELVITQSMRGKGSPRNLSKEEKAKLSKLLKQYQKARYARIVPANITVERNVQETLDRLDILERGVNRRGEERPR